MTETVLLDLGGVVLGIDFRRVFAHWAEQAGVDEQHFHENWAVDDAYRSHETGAIDFAQYCDNLQIMFGVKLTQNQWRDGWNAIWTEPFASVVSLLPDVAGRYRLFGFTNTNDTHALSWRSSYPEALSAFEHIFVSSEIGYRKPDHAAFAHVCAEMGQTPGEVLFFDDSAENIRGATDCGLQARHVAGEQAVYEALLELL
jgi:putative hydrolase of the HAD superfamily